MIPFVLAAVLVLVPAVFSPQNKDALKAQLRQKDQALLDAFAPGDRAAWDAVLAPNFIYADENNVVMDRAAFLKQLTPLPRGAGGSIAIASYDLDLSGDTAIVVHRDEETEQYFGSQLHAQYLQTETWQQLHGKWMLRAVHCAAIPVDAPTIELSTQQMDELVGAFRAGTLTYVVRKEGNRLLGGQPGQDQVELKAETRDVLIVPGRPRSRKVFLRDQAGKVTGFADRRENRDLVWTRVN